MQKVPAWKTSDGQIHTDKKTAERHERQLQRRPKFEAFVDVLWERVDPHDPDSRIDRNELVDFLMENTHKLLSIL